MRRIQGLELPKLNRINKKFKENGSPKHSHVMDSVIVGPMPGGGVFNSRKFKICFECGEVTRA